MAPRYRARRFFLVAGFIALVLLLPFLLGQAQFAMSEAMVDPDMFVLYGFARYHDPSLFQNDYTADYLLSQWMPVGYRILFQAWSTLFDPKLLERLLLPVLWISCLWPVYVCGRALGGRCNGFATVAIYACSSIFIFRMVGGMAHGFGFPLTWWAVAALLSGHVVGLAVVTVLAALFYPIIAPVAGMTLALFVLFPGLSRGVRRQGRWLSMAWLARAMWLAVPGILALGLILPMVWPQASAYGPAINVLTQRDEFPEAANPLASINPFAYTIAAYALQNSTRLGMNFGQILTLAIFGVLFASVLLRDARDTRPGKIKPYLYAVMFFFLLSLLFMPDQAYRFAIYNFPVLMTLFLPLALRDLTRLAPRRMRAAAFAVLVLGYVGLIAQADAQASGYLFVMEPFQQRANAFIATLPKDVMVAGWPGDRYGRIVESVPYVAQRRALVTWAGHAVAHKAYVLEMRERMNAVVDAYLARDLGPIRALRERWGVDYLIVNAQDFETAPAYIEPFTRRAASLWKQNMGHFSVLTIPEEHIVYRDGDVRIIGLKGL